MNFARKPLWKNSGTWKEFSLKIFLFASCSHPTTCGCFAYYIEKNISKKVVDWNFRQINLQIVLSSAFPPSEFRNRLNFRTCSRRSNTHMKRKISLVPLITATVLALWHARDSLFCLHLSQNAMQRRTCPAHSKPVVSSDQFHKNTYTHVASDTPTEHWQTDTRTHTHTHAPHPLHPITFVVRAHGNRWLNYTRVPLVCQSKTKKKTKKRFLRISPPKSERASRLRRQRRLFSARLRPIDNVRCNQSFKRIKHPPAKPPHHRPRRPSVDEYSDNGANIISQWLGNCSSFPVK